VTVQVRRAAPDRFFKRVEPNKATLVMGNPEQAVIDRAEKSHQRGLEYSLRGSLIPAHYEFLLAASNADHVHDPLFKGRLERDWARVHAGLGRKITTDTKVKQDLFLKRNQSIRFALMNHDRIYKAPDEFDVSPDLAATELGATHHVAARVEFARFLDGSIAYYRDLARIKMGDHWQEALDLLDRPNGNTDYLHQALGHGTLALATFGNEEQAELTEQFLDRAHDVRKDMSKKRRAAVLLAGAAATSQVARRAIQPIAAKEVAGPYREK
jgi:hypothetical protein